MVTEPTYRRRNGDSDDDAVRSPRQRVLLSILAESERPLSATELAQMTGQTLGATAHHVRALARAGLIAWAGERRVRGAMQTFYRPTEEGLAALRRPRTEALLTLVGVRASYDDHAPAMMPLDDEARRELEALVDKVRPEVRAIIQRAASRKRS
ncbi:MAG TPA: helix-turn-helix domain-containing protein [Baekduia sp.]|nr:helix-turn-helix domain-containing protein [Baekduia sp.]